MEWQLFLEKSQGLPIIRTEDLLIGSNNSDGMEVQLSRWTKAGKLTRLKRGTYLLAKTYRQIEPFTPYVAATLIGPSYISLHKALGHYDLIPEGVWVNTSVTTKRPARYETSLGVFQYRHIQAGLFWGYHSVSDGHQTGFMASPEKALLDLFYFTKGRIDEDYLEGMRLQNFEVLNHNTLVQMAQRFRKPKLKRAVDVLLKFMERQVKEEVIL